MKWFSQKTLDIIQWILIVGLIAMLIMLIEAIPNRGGNGNGQSFTAKTSADAGIPAAAAGGTQGR